MSSSKVTIVIPVYRDWPSLKDCMDSLKEYVDSSKHQVILVNDCGPEAELMERNIKENIAGLKNFHYYKNKKNLGFVRTCNRAVNELDKTSNHILLLNSDTKVTEGFLDEMLEILKLNEKIGAVTPRSNNASIFTVPISAAVKKGIDPSQSYEIFMQIKDRLPRHRIVPVAHGFCMLIRRSLIKKYGLFDEIFGRGYGEEVDFCQRLQKHGYLCAVSNRAYVFHMEARSFSLETKNKLMEVNNKIIWERYPDYRQSVRDYMDKTIPEERKIEEESGVETSYIKESPIKKAIKRHSVLYKVARKIKR